MIQMQARWPEDGVRSADLFDVIRVLHPTFEDDSKKKADARDATGLPPRDELINIDDSCSIK